MRGTRVGSKVYVETSYGTFRELVLGEMVGGDGAVGAAYQVDGSPRECVKVFHDSSAETTTVVRIPKIKEIIEKYVQGEIGGFAALPKSIVYEGPGSGTPIGYLMDYFEGVPLSDIAYQGASDPADYRTRLLAALGLAKCVAHAHGVSSDPVTRHIVIGDLSLANALYQPSTGNVRIVDADSFQVVGRINNRMVVYPVTEMRSSTYETVLANKPMGKFALTSRSDNVLLAECIFRLLIQCDPFDDLSLEDVDFDEERNKAIAGRRYPYVESVCEPMVQPETVVGHEIADLFVRSFTGPYENVPTAQEYRDALQRLLDDLPSQTNVRDELNGNGVRTSNKASNKGGTVLRQPACDAPVSDKGLAASLSGGYLRGVSSKKRHLVSVALVERVSAFAPWLVLFFLVSYHATAFLPLGIVPFIRSFLCSYNTVVAIASSLGFIFWRRYDSWDSSGIGLKMMAIVLMATVGLLCPSVSGGLQVIKDDVLLLLIRFGIL